MAGTWTTLLADIKSGATEAATRVTARLASSAVRAIQSTTRPIPVEPPIRSCTRTRRIVRCQSIRYTPRVPRVPRPVGEAEAVLEEAIKRQDASETLH